ncbi:hypothetical protein [Desulforamulus reducens]|uniref:hypothetical protein n=1 Tax=Desulforamulus reducens TaxID=59610 RepID=UPI00006BE89B|nr:hypothetical protein [Desulforamulus reducens]
MKTLKESLKEFVCLRVNDAACIEAMHDQDHVKYVQQLSSLFNQIKGLLGKDYKLIIEYETTVISLNSLVAEYAYKRGVKDGFSINKELAS